MLVVMRSRNDRPTIDKWAEQIECAKALKASIVADCRSLRIPNDPSDRNFDFAAEVTGLAADEGVRVCLETGGLEKLLKAGERIETLSYCLDTGRANLDRSFSFRRYVDGLAGRISHLHLNDNYGALDDHEPPGLRGGIPHEDWQYLLETLQRQNGDVIASLEMSPSMPEVLIRQAAEFIFDELKWPDRPRLQQAVQPQVVYNSP
jgi:sugar phosphate isomerase/epimerase